MSSEEPEEADEEAAEEEEEEVAIDLGAPVSSSAPSADPISIRRILFAMALALVVCFYTLGVGPLRWAALCIGVGAVEWYGAEPPVRHWLAWLAYGAVGSYCRLNTELPALDAWLSLLSIGTMLASFAWPAGERLALAAALALPPASALAPELPLIDFLLKSAAFGGLAAGYWRRGDAPTPTRTLWILWVPALSPLALVGALLHYALTLRELAPTKPEHDKRAAPKKRRHHGTKNHP